MKVSQSHLIAVATALVVAGNSLAQVVTARPPITRESTPTKPDIASDQHEPAAPARTAPALEQLSTVIPVKSRLKKFMPNRHNEKLKQSKTGKVDLVMIGDSITHNWESMDDYEAIFAGCNLLNLGFAGDRTQNVLWRLRHGAVDGISPRLVTLLIGVNHAHEPRRGYVPDEPADVLAGIKAIVAELRDRLPKAKIVVLSVLPREPASANERVKAINAMLLELTDRERVFHADITAGFLDGKGRLRTRLYNRDRLHLTKEGYAALAKALRPLLKEHALELNLTPPRREK